jgi:broad specificity phosphatase PhoE
MRLAIVRHAQTEWNRLGRAQGSIDIELDDEGIRQAECAARSFRGGQYAEVLTSDLKRSAQTAALIARESGIEVMPEPRLREIALGDWEGRSFDDVRADMASGRASDDPYILHFRPPNGESIMDVWERIRPLAEELSASDRPRIVVTHGGVGGLLLAHLLRGTPEQGRSFRFANTGIMELERHRLVPFSLIRYNCTAHLDGTRVLSGSADGVIR